MPSRSIRKICLATTFAFLLYFLIAVNLQWQQMPHIGTLVAAWLSTQLLIFAGRVVLRRSCARFLGWGYRAVVGGDRELVEKILPLLQSGRYGLRVVEVIERPDKIDECFRKAQEQGIRWVVFIGDRRSLPDSTRKVIHKFSHLITIAPTLGDSANVLTCQWPAGILPIVQYENKLVLPTHRCTKYVLDIILSLLLCLALLPVFVTIALLIKLSSPGPVFYSHWRIGRNEKSFRLWKFRTMMLDADARLEEYLTANPELREEWEKEQKLQHDPRITKIGLFLRKFSLDELPQLWNVLKGDMSLVGPRPIVTAEIKRYAESFESYKLVLPGITGLWQVSGRNNTTYPVRVALDAYYVRNWSIWMDLYILLCTFKAVMRGDGAC